MTSVTKRIGAPRTNLWESLGFARVWGFFRSVRLALVLILALAAVLLIGTILQQVPPSIRADGAAYEQWLEQARLKYGPWTDLLEHLDFFSVFQAPYFRALIALLVINIVVCTLNRWRSISITVFRSRVRMTDGFFQHARFNATFESPMPAPEAARRMKRSLSFARYRVNTETGAQSIALLADKNRFSVYGTFLTHLSIVLILAGAVIGGVFGFKDPQFVVAEDSTRGVAGTELSVRLEHFADEYYLDGRPKDFRSEVTLFKDGQEVKRATIRVNSPLRYDGITFHQSFYGQTAVMKVEDSGGRELYRGGVPLSWQTRDGGRPAGLLTLSEQGISVWVIGPRPGENDPLVRPGEMRLEIYNPDGDVDRLETLTQGEPKEIDGLTFTFERESRFTGLKVVKDPGVTIIWVACTLLVLGIVVLFYFPRLRAWALLTERPDGTTEVKLAMPSQRNLSPAGDFRRLRTRVGRVLLSTSATLRSKDGEGGDRA